MWNNIFPPSQWLKSYRLKDLRSDAFSGITLAAYAIPVSMAYASLAGLPVQYGIYGYLIGGLLYALFGTGMQLAVGPTSAISLLIGTTLATMSGGDPAHLIGIASLTALMVAIISLLAWLLRLNSFVNFISESVLLGFKAGAAITIALTQLPKLFGVESGGLGFFDRAVSLFRHLPETNPTVLLFGLISLVLLVIGKKILPGRPVSIFLVIASILLISNTALLHAGFHLTGTIAKGLPGLKIPDMKIEDIDSIIPLAFACFLLAYIESVSAAKTLANEAGYEIDTHQELLALTAANAAAAFGQGFPISGGLSQSAINSRAGAKTPLSLVFASVTIGLCLLFLTGPLEFLPDVVLSVILLYAISSLIDIKGLKRLWKISRMEFSVAMISFGGVLVFGILKGVVLAAISSIVMILIAISNPHIAFLGRVPGTKRYTDIGRHPDNELIPGLLLLRVEASILYFNVENIRIGILSEVLASGEALKCVIWDFSTSPYVDTAGAGLIRKLYLELRNRGIELKIAEAHAEVRDMLRAEELEHLLGHISRKVSIDDLVNGSTNDTR
ncbi:MAG: SulP family inorganic anion transporter [Prolixibacteraceae bacterium]